MLCSDIKKMVHNMDSMLSSHQEKMHLADMFVNESIDVTMKQVSNHIETQTCAIEHLYSSTIQELKTQVWPDLMVYRLMYCEIKILNCMKKWNKKNIVPNLLNQSY